VSEQKIKITHKENKFVEFFWRIFKCYNHIELKCPNGRFLLLGFVVRLHLLFKIYLLQIQFIMISNLV